MHLSAFLGRGKGQTLLTLFEVCGFVTYILYAYGSTFHCMQGESVDIDEAIASLQVQAPSIVAFGETSDFPTDIKITIEGSVFAMPSVVSAIHFCFASYYIFNISFPPDFRLIMLVLEKFVYNLKTSVSKLSLSLKRVSATENC